MTSRCCARRGHWRDRELSGNLRLRGVAHCRDRVGPVAHEDRVAILESEARLLFVPGEHVERCDVGAIELVAHELEGAHGFRPVHHDFATIVDDASAKRAQVLDEAGDQSLVARALRYDTIAWGPAPRHRRLRVADHLFQRPGFAGDEIGATVQKPDVGEPRQGVQFFGPGVGRDRRRKEFGFHRSIAIEREYPAGGGEFGGPHDIELEDRWISNARVEPLYVKLVSLRRVVGRPLQLDADPRVEPHETLQLLGDERAFRAEG